MESTDPVPDLVAQVLEHYRSRGEPVTVFRTVLRDGVDVYVVVGTTHVSWVRDDATQPNPTSTFPIAALVGHDFVGGGGHSYSFAGQSLAVHYTGQENGEQIATAILARYRASRQR